MHRSSFVALVVAAALVLAFPMIGRGGESGAKRLADDLQPWLSILSGNQKTFRLSGEINVTLDGKPRRITLKLDRFDDEAFDLELIDAEYAVSLRRRSAATAFALPKHGVVYLGRGKVDDSDRLAPRGITRRLLSPGSMASVYAPLVMQAEPATVAGTLTALLRPTFDPKRNAWTVNQNLSFRFATDDATVTVQANDARVTLQISEPTAIPDVDDWPGMKVAAINRTALERQLTRGVRRAFEILAPAPLLTTPSQENRTVDHGELRWIDGQRVVLLHGTPEEIGRAHGELLTTEARRCIDSVLYTFGTAQTIRTGRWFRHDLETAYARLSPHIPEDHKRETRAMAESLELEPQLANALNVFPELFHCSGFAVFGKATKDGKLYHGRVLDYMTTIGLQDSATTFIIAVDGKIPFANVGYAGFVGSVSGMNAQAISLGEMGGRGEGKWDGAPMATLMRRALEECSTLDEVIKLWKTSPRTCEYYYVFADGKSNRAVGVAADPESVEFVLPGQSHARLGEGIEDAVVLSAGSRLVKLRERIEQRHGQIDTKTAQWLMSRPVAMRSNLHNVLFVPQDRVLLVANADHRRPAAERPYVRLDLAELLESMSGPLTGGRTFEARDTLDVGTDASNDARQCLRGLTWPARKFSVRCDEPTHSRYDVLVRFPSPVASGNAANDQVAMEWYLARDKQRNPLHAPAVVVVHESGSSMTVGQVFAQGLRRQGLHAFMVHLPYYGERREGQKRPDADNLVTVIRQAVADVRRARDAVAALPHVDSTHIALQGTSLGGFVSATTACLDRGYDSVFLMLAGGQLYDLIQNGKKDTAKVREKLDKAGLTDEKLRSLLWTIEPTRIAHRMDPHRTWLFSAKYDTVVPVKNAMALATSAGLNDQHHIHMLANHYTGIVYLPFVLQHMQKQIAVIHARDNGAARAANVPSSDATD